MTEKLKGNTGNVSPTRIANLLAIVDKLRTHPMSVAEMAELIGYGKSCATKYVYELRGEGVIVVKEIVESSRSKQIDKVIYKLNPNKSLVLAYIDRINAIGVESRDRVQRRSDAKLHVMQDDEVFKVKRASDKIPAHHELMQALFGMNREVTA